MTIILHAPMTNKPDSFIVESASWRLASDDKFTNILAESLEDSDNKRTKMFVGDWEDLDFIYAQVRVEYNKGYSEWSEIQVFKPVDNMHITLEEQLPTVVEVPNLEIISAQDLENHPVVDGNNLPVQITARVQFVTTVENIKHKRTTWLLTDETDVVLDHSLNDEVNLTEYTFDNVELQRDKLYRVKASVTGTNNSESGFATKTTLTVL